jgi:hypothetical protein
VSPAAAPLPCKGGHMCVCVSLSSRR